MYVNNLVPASRVTVDVNSTLLWYILKIITLYGELGGIV